MIIYLYIYVCMYIYNAPPDISTGKKNVNPFRLIGN